MDRYQIVLELKANLRELIRMYSSENKTAGYA